jgi:[ribosomal protein S5]-alanine N-acetyltransferase
MEIPLRLTTPRLRLREPRLSDAPAIFEAYTQDAEVAKYMVWRPHKELSETSAFLASCVASWEERTRLPYVLTLAEADTAIGMLEARPKSHIVDVGYVLARSYWGRGLVPEALSELASACLSLPEVFRVQATCDVENIASARTLEKAGFKLEGRLERHTMHPNVSLQPRACYMYARTR